MLKVDTGPRHRNAPRPAEKSAPSYLQWLRTTRKCACGGRNPDCQGKLQAAHGPDKATKGMGTKCRDSAAMPLSVWCHSLQHSLGWQTFEMNYLPGEALAVADAYWKEWLRTPQGRNWLVKNDG